MIEEINFTYSGNVIEKVNTFNYLGLVFTNNGSFQNALKTLAGKAARAMSDLLQITRHKEIPLKIMINLFDSFVAKMTITTYRNAVAKLRLSAHNLLIEIGRHRNIIRNERICLLCTLNEVEDEYHFLLICPAYNELRHLYLKKYYYNSPSMIKLIQLLNCDNVKVLNGIGIFYIKANEMRKNELSIVSD